MTEHADKENNKEQSSERKDESWKPDKELEEFAYYGGTMFSREDLRESLQELEALLLKEGTPEKLFSRKADLSRINMTLNEFIDIQQQEYIAVLQWRMLKKALKHLIELNSSIAQLLRRMINFEDFNKEKLNLNGLLDMAKRSSKEAIAGWYPNKFYKNGKLDLNQSDYSS
jgi:hypothetical protein